MKFACPSWPPDWPEIRAAVDAVMTSGEWGRYHSSICAETEKRLAEMFAVPAARLCCSGTAALEIALRATNVGPGDEVILAAYDYPGNFRTIELLGARPVLVDNRSLAVANGDAPETETRFSLSLDPSQLESAASDSVRAVIATHLYGQAAEMEQVRTICEQRRWILIEDACQAIGMQIAGAYAGTLGDIATLSFGGSKQVSAGGGGALLVKSERLAARLGPLMERPGDVYPMGPLQAASLGPQLDRLTQLNQQRVETAIWLGQQNERLPSWRSLHAPSPMVTSSPYKIAWLAEDPQHRNRIVDVATAYGIPLGAGYRSASRSSPRRCRKPVSTPVADSFGDRLFVLDHRALLVDASQRESLLDVLVEVHDATLPKAPLG